MTTPNEPDPTMPVPTGGEPTQAVPPVAGGEPTQAVPRVAGGEPTIPVQGETFGGGPGGPGGTGEGFDEGDDNRRLWMIALGVLLIALIIGILIAVLAGGGGDSTDTTTTSSSSSSTTSSSTTTTAPPTTTAPGPQVQQFTVNSSSVSCPSTSQVTLTWSTQNANDVTVSIDDPNGPFGNYAPTDTEQFPFACGGGPDPVQHTYYLRANGAGGQNVQKQLTVTGTFPPATTTTTDP